MRRLLLLVAGVAAFVVYRRWHARWGATDEEVLAPMPGDERLARTDG